MPAARLGSLLILTEDSASTGHATIVAVVKRMLQLVVPDYQTHRIGIRAQGRAGAARRPGDRMEGRDPEALRGAQPGPAHHRHQAGPRGWVRAVPHRRRPDLEPPRFQRERGEVRDDSSSPGFASCSGGARAARRRTPRPGCAGCFPVVPFYSIEAWLFQHTEVAVRLCREKYKGRDVGKFEAWQRDRAALDDVEKPKEAVCLLSAHNLECAGSGYPAQEVFDAGRSYAACVERLRACVELKSLLDATAGRQGSDT